MVERCNCGRNAQVNEKGKEMKEAGTGLNYMASFFFISQDKK